MPRRYGSLFERGKASDPRDLTGFSEEADEWLKTYMEASTFEEQYRLAAEQSTACLRDLKAARDLHDTHPVVASLIQAVEQRDVTGYSQSREQTRQIEQTRRDQEDLVVE